MTTGYFSKEKYGDETVGIRKKNLFKASIWCGVFLALGTNLQQIGLVTVSAGKVGFISAIYIVMVPIIGLFFGDNVGKKLWMCVALALVGFMLLSLNGGLGGITSGDLLTLAGAFFFAAQIVCINMHVTQDNSLILSTTQMIVSGIISLTLMFIFEDHSVATLMSGALPIMYSALFPTAIGFTLQVVGQQYVNPTTASLILSLEAVFGAIFGIFFLHETMTPREFAGSVLIFSSILAAQMPDKKGRAEIREIQKMNEKKESQNRE